MRVRVGDTEQMLTHPMGMRMLVVLSALGGLFAVGTPARSEPPAEDRPRTIRVRVVEANDATRAVPDARVKAFRGIPLTGGMVPSCVIAAGGDTDPSGWVSITLKRRPPRGAVYLQVTASGYTMARRLTPRADEEQTDVVVRLRRGVDVLGRVVFVDGRAAKGVRVWGEQPEQWGWTEASHVATTDESGAFRLAGYAPSWVTLHAKWQQEDVVWVAQTTVKAGVTNALVALPAEPARRRLRLLVKGADGRPVAFARWKTESHRWGGHSMGTVQDGMSTLPAVADEQWVTIRGPRDEKESLLPWATTVVGPLGSQGGDLEVVMPLGHTIAGTVRNEKGEPRSGIYVVAIPLFTLTGTEQIALGGNAASDLTDFDGRFRIDRVPPGRVEVSVYSQDATHGDADPVRLRTTPGQVLDFVMHSPRQLRGRVRLPDGTSASHAALYVRDPDTLFPYDVNDVQADQWKRIGVSKDGMFTLHYSAAPRGVRLRAGRHPLGVSEMAGSEVSVMLGADVEPVLTVPPGRDLRVRIPDWPVGEPGAVRIACGAHSSGRSKRILNGAAHFEGIAREPLSVYCGPLPDGRIAYGTHASKDGDELRLGLVASRTVRGQARGVPSDAIVHRVWADNTTFEVRGHLWPTGQFQVRGVPLDVACRVCVVFKRGEELWAGSSRVLATGPIDGVDVELQRIDVPLADWVSPRPPP